MYRKQLHCVNYQIANHQLTYRYFTDSINLGDIVRASDTQTNQQQMCYLNSSTDPITYTRYSAGKDGDETCEKSQAHGSDN
jgi:hypothetical protein